MLRRPVAILTVGDVTSGIRCIRIKPGKTAAKAIDEYIRSKKT